MFGLGVRHLMNSEHAINLPMLSAPLPRYQPAWLGSLVPFFNVNDCDKQGPRPAAIDRVSPAIGRWRCQIKRCARKAKSVLEGAWPKTSQTIDTFNQTGFKHAKWPFVVRNAVIARANLRLRLPTTENPVRSLSREKESEGVCRPRRKNSEA